MLNHDLDYQDSPWQAEYFDLLPKNTCLDGGGGGASAASQAAAAQTAAAERAAQLEKEMYDATVARVAPWTQAGTGAVNYLGGILNIPGYTKIDPTNALRATPGYDWAMTQGTRARDLSAARRGLLLSGAQQKALTTFGQGLADQTYQNYLNNLFNVSGSGLNAAGMVTKAGMNYADQAGQDYIYGGNAAAQGILGAYQARQSGYNSLGSILGMGAAIVGPLLGNIGSTGLNYLSNAFTPAPSYVSDVGGGFYGGGWGDYSNIFGGE